MLERLRGVSAPDVDEADSSVPGELSLVSGGSGLLAATRILTESGWKSVGHLSVGEQVQTFDRGFQPVCDIQREVHRPGGTGVVRAVRVPDGALGNAGDVTLLPDQGQLIESDAARDASGEPYAIIRARSLVGFRGVSLSAMAETMDMRLLVFEEDAVVYCESGFLLFCPAPRDLLNMSDDNAGSIYPVLPLDEARRLVSGMMDAYGKVSGFTYDPEEVQLPA